MNTQLYIHTLAQGLKYSNATADGDTGRCLEVDIEEVLINTKPGPWFSQPKMQKFVTVITVANSCLIGCARQRFLYQPSILQVTEFGSAIQN